MKSVELLVFCLCSAYVIVRGLLGTAYDVVNWLLRWMDE